VPTSQALQQAISNLSSEIEESGGTIEFEDLPTVNADAGQLHKSSRTCFRTPLSIGSVTSGRGFACPPRGRTPAGCSRWQTTELASTPAEAEAIFKPFRRLHGKDYPGSGIGLSICKRIVERSGGEIWAEAAEAVGSTFSLRFRLHRQTDRLLDRVRLPEREEVAAVRIASGNPPPNQGRQVVTRLTASR
jgi:light-regulated signal transduction histidine kinase (bacteriophytochrome)